MHVNELTPANRPTFYFVGVTTGKSSIMTVFPRWATHLGLGDTPIVGIDCEVHDDPAVYRRVVQFLKHDELSLGALVTTHKLDLFEACEDLFDELDPHARRLGEVSSISKRGGRLIGHAKDPITSGLSFESFVPDGYFRKTGTDVCLLGAGGSSRALTLYLMQIRDGQDLPARILVTDRDASRLQDMRAIHGNTNRGIEIEYVQTATCEENDAVVRRLKPASIVINATGLGKDAPGSPLTAAAEFPRDAMVWDFNYRGELAFLDQARVQQRERNIHVEDGWTYFLHGWTRVIAEVFQIDIPTRGPAFDQLLTIARATRTVKKGTLA